MIHVTPLLKKHNLDQNELKKYRLISKLPHLSKICERILSIQINSYLTANNLYPPNQSAYRKYHSTETTMLYIFENILNELDNGNYVQMVLLDMYAAFDSISHAILLHGIYDIGI